MQKSMEYNGFISYRRSSSAGYAALIKTKLQYEFKKNIFLDVEAITSGPYEMQIFDSIRKVDHFIVLLAPDSLVQKTDDLFHKEIIYAIDNKKIIIPVILPGFVIPEDLTGLDDIREVLKYQAIHYDIQQPGLNSSIAKINDFLNMVPKKDNAQITFEDETNEYLFFKMWRNLK
jgi:hypothetical protein